MEGWRWGEAIPPRERADARGDFNMTPALKVRGPRPAPPGERV